MREDYQSLRSTLHLKSNCTVLYTCYEKSNYKQELTCVHVNSKSAHNYVILGIQIFNFQYRKLD